MFTEYYICNRSARTYFDFFAETQRCNHIFSLALRERVRVRVGLGPVGWAAPTDTVSFQRRLSMYSNVFVGDGNPD